MFQSAQTARRHPNEVSTPRQRVRQDLFFYFILYYLMVPLGGGGAGVGVSSLGKKVFTSFLPRFKINITVFLSWLSG